LDPDNTNLLNSLGVALAMLDNNGEAKLCFQRALQADAANYMALCNLGFIAQAQDQLDEAIDFFTRALPLAAEDEQIEQRDNEGHRLAQDLRFYLGRLYCQTGRYDEAVKILKKWQQLCANERQRRKAWRYLGEALAGTGERRQAMAALQRALAANPGDHEAMSLLGELIMRSHEGDEIALSLCRKSVELMPYSPLYRLRLAEAEYHIGDLPSALAHCPRPGRLKAGQRAKSERRIVSLLADIYRQMGETKKAAYWAARK
jgi:tetratricopeptide (TPR) repeat protein